MRKGGEWAKKKKFYRMAELLFKLITSFKKAVINIHLY